MPPVKAEIRSSLYTNNSPYLPLVPLCYLLSGNLPQLQPPSNKQNCSGIQSGGRNRWEGCEGSSGSKGAFKYRRQQLSLWSLPPAWEHHITEELQAHVKHWWDVLDLQPSFFMSCENGHSLFFFLSKKNFKKISFPSVMRKNKSNSECNSSVHWWNRGQNKYRNSPILNSKIHTELQQKYFLFWEHTARVSFKPLATELLGR